MSQGAPVLSKRVPFSNVIQPRHMPSLHQHAEALAAPGGLNELLAHDISAWSPGQYLSGSHLRQFVPAPTEYHPGLHKHSACVLTPMVLFEFNRHSVAWVPPGQKKPTGQGSHGPPLGPTNPALHTQSVCSSLPTPDSELAGQSKHTLDPKR